MAAATDPGGPTPAAPLTRLEALGLAGALALGVGLRLAIVQPVGLWTDECVSYWAASAPTALEVCYRSLGYTTHPPLYFLVLHASLAAFGHSEWALRWPSLAAGMLAPAAAFLALRRLTGRSDVALLTALLAAIDPHQMAMSRIARPYALAALLTYVSVWLYAGLAPGTRWRWLAWAFGHALLIQCNYLFAGLAAVQILVYRIAGPRPRRLSAAGWLGLAALAALTLPWLSQAVRLYGRGPTLVFSQAPALRDVVPVWLDGVVLVWAAGAGLAVVWSLVSRRRPSAVFLLDASTGLVLLAWYVLPVGALFLLSHLTWAKLFCARYLTAFLAALPAVAAWMLLGLPGRWFRRAAVAAALAAVVIARYDRFGQEEWRWAHEDWRRPVQTLVAGVQPGDVVLFNAGLVEARQVHQRRDDPLFQSYLQAPLAGLYGRPGAPVINLGHELHPDAPRTDYMDRVVLPQIRSAERVWLLVRHWLDRRLWPDLVAWIGQVEHGRFRLAEVFMFQGEVLGLVVNEGRRPPPGAPASGPGRPP